MNCIANQRFSPHVFIAGWCALLLYAGAYSPLGLGIATLVGSVDRTHQVGLQAGGQGAQLVLRHGPNGIAHRHGVAARVLTIFAQPLQTGQTDHVLQFSASDSFSRQAQLNTPSPGTFAQPDFALIETSLPSPREGFLSSVPTHPPPGDDGQLVCLRSTLLLI